MATSPEPAHASLAPTVGTSVPRVDGAAKVTGKARYVDDLPRMPG
jgi:CO/xanthine dehydrogenase Mo-binding subunit